MSCSYYTGARARTHTHTLTHSHTCINTYSPLARIPLLFLVSMNFLVFFPLPAKHHSKVSFYVALFHSFSIADHTSSTAYILYNPIQNWMLMFSLIICSYTHIVFYLMLTSLIYFPSYIPVLRDFILHCCCFFTQLPMAYIARRLNTVFTNALQ